MLQVVWFKKDLRVTDHAPLSQAASAGPVLPIYVYEPDIMASEDYAVQHHAFLNECLTELACDVFRLGSPLVKFHDEITRVLAEIKNIHGPFRLLSHEETGNGVSFTRDKRVAAFCKAQGIEWCEFPSNGVVRRLKNRDEWQAHWQARMGAPLLPSPVSLTPPAKRPSGVEFISPRGANLVGDDKPERQRGGRSQTLARLEEFFATALADYRYSLSSPLSAASACSRLSPGLAFGCVSMRELIQRVWALRDSLAARDPAQVGGWLASLKAFEARLHWRCHFIQKLEDEPRLEFANMHSAFDGVRTELNLERHEAWCAGETGYPMVDACMKMLKHTGWINFRMRAMLVSFSSYQLWNPWQAPARFLAREFLDYEPGIHYPQIQMQSGVTGINLIRIYNPVKQSIDQDRAGIFLRRWLPALRGVEQQHLHTPWTSASPPKGYPAPIVDYLEAARHARDTLWQLRASAKARDEAAKVLDKHGSRAKAPRRKSAARSKKPDSPQLAFDFDAPPT
jgi:deoxyribodipyrimidine photo-lyase